MLTGCSRKEETEPPKPVIFFAPAAVTNVPDLYKPLYLGNIPADTLEAFRAKLPYDSISLERTPCDGPCPVYRVTLYRSGKAELEAKAHLPQTGEFTGQVDLLTYARLCYALDNGRFKDFSDQYRANLTDNTACIITVTSGNNQKSVTDYGNIGPIQLWALEQTIDGIRQSISWQPVK